MELGDPARASVIFLDIVSRDEWTGKTAYTRATSCSPARSMSLVTTTPPAAGSSAPSKTATPTTDPPPSRILIDLALQDKRAPSHKATGTTLNASNISSFLSTLQP
jgi:hypothetical protein